ncbi:MAG: hypothetical protein ACI92Z_003703 [Paracoccaceae bacterium]|jgi:hypothetical protein
MGDPFGSTICCSTTTLQHFYAAFAASSASASARSAYTLVLIVTARHGDACMLNRLGIQNIAERAANAVRETHRRNPVRIDQQMGGHWQISNA